METINTTLAGVTLSNWLGLSGAVLTTIGVVVTLIGTRRFRTWLASRRSDVPKASGGATGTVSMTGKARGRVGPPAEGITLEWVYETHQRQIDGLAAEIDSHGHPAIDEQIARAQLNTDNVRTEMVKRFEGINNEAARAEAWSIRGLVLVGSGALLQLGAVVAAGFA